MKYNLLTVIILFIILSFALVFLKAKKNYLIHIIIVLVLFWGILGTVAFRYYTNQQFRLSVDLIFKQAKYHSALTENNIPLLPLPRNTAFAFRYSEEGAAYCTTLDKDDIITYFKKISDKGSFVRDSSSTGEKEYLKFSYKNTPFTVSIEKNNKPKGNYMFIDSDTK